MHLEVAVAGEDPPRALQEVIEGEVGRDLEGLVAADG
jgi:hypothetical protein